MLQIASKQNTLPKSRLLMEEIRPYHSSKQVCYSINVVNVFHYLPLSLSSVDVNVES